MTSELEQLADVCGLLTAYEDVNKRRRQASVESLLGGLNALGVDVPSPDDVPRILAEQQAQQLERGVEPVLVAWDGAPLEFDLTLPKEAATEKASCTISLDDDAGEVSQRIDLGAAPRESACGRFVTRRVRLKSGFGDGYHRLRIAPIGGRTAEFESLVISAPRRAYEPAQGPARQWGCFLPLYALRSERNWGAGDFTDLENLSEWTAGQGGRVLGTLPLLAAFLDEPCEPSPYAPSSRLAWNEFYVDVERVPELADCADAARLIRSADFAPALDELRSLELVDYRRVMADKRRVLELLSEAFFARRPQDRYAQFETFLSRHPHVEDYASFRAAQERRAEPWQRWPQPMRDGRLAAGDFDPRNKRYHLYAQWTAASQLERLADSAGGGLYLDLPLGVRPDGYDVWKWRDRYACGASAGSPPDAVWTQGQDWSFPPLHPQRIREAGYRHVRDYLSHHLKFARMLRVDHVMQLHRLYWIPQGLSADRGVYVRYHPEEFYAILSLESHRSRTMLIGENLGTVPPEVDRSMDRHNVKQMYVVQYEVAESEVDQVLSPPVVAPSPDVVVAPSPDRATPPTAGLQSGGRPAVERSAGSGDPRTTGAGSGDPRTTRLGEVPPGAVASVNTHDMPMFAAWWRGEDIALRQRLGLIDEGEARRERTRFDATKTDLIRWLRSEGWLDDEPADDAQVLRAILRFLAAGQAGVVLVNLEDLWLETRPQNVPGTGPELNNWQRKAAMPWEQMSHHPQVLKALNEVAALRRQQP